MAWFRILYAKNAFVRSLGGVKPDSLLPEEGLDAMIDFYRDHRAQHTEAGDDVLEFAWKTNNDGFQLAICRRMQRHDSDEPSRTLELAYRFAASELGDAVAGGQLGCQEPDDLGRFRREVLGTAAWRIAADAAVQSQSLEER
jgi:phosphoglycolate phosphatase-like HAD superfamily hydrolase